MLDRLREILSRIKFTRKKNIPDEEAPVPQEDGGKIYALWLLILPLLVGFVLGRLAGVGMGFALDKFAGTRGVTAEAVTGARDDVEDVSKPRGLDGFLAANPFKISPVKPVEVPKEAPKPSADVKPKEPPSTLDDVILRGTLPALVRGSRTREIYSLYSSEKA